MKNLNNIDVIQLQIIFAMNVDIHAKQDKICISIKRLCMKS